MFLVRSFKYSKFKCLENDRLQLHSFPSKSKAGISLDEKKAGISSVNKNIYFTA